MMPRRTAAFAWRLALAAVAAALLWRVIQVNLVLYQDNGRPRLAPADVASKGDQAALHTMVRDNPAEVAALLMIAHAYDVEGKGAEAQAAYRAALDLAPMDKDVLAHSASYFLRQGDARGVEMLGRLAAHFPVMRERVFATLHEVIAARRHRPAVVALFAHDPAWLGEFVRDACARGVDPATYVPLLLRRAAGGAPLPQAGCAIERLRATGRWAEAYQLWLNILPRERLAEVGHVFNGGFEHAVSGTGFDWVLQPLAEREAGHVAEAVPAQGAAGRRALRVAYNGKRQSGVAARQYLVLGPGDYELTGLARPQGIVAPRGLQWSVRCADGARAAPLAVSERFVGSSEWRRFSMEIAVDGSCPAQLLQLEPATEAGAVAYVGGIAWFDDLAIRRR